MVVKYKVVDPTANKDSKDNKPLYVIIKFTVESETLEIGGRQRNFDYINDIASLFVEDLDKEADMSFYQKSTVRYTIKGMTYNEVKEKIKMLKDDNDYHIEDINNISRLM